DHLVPGRIAVGIAREGKPRKAVVPTRGEEDERVPASAPGRTDRVGGLEDHETLALTREEVADRQPRLPRPDHDDVVASRCSLHRRHPRSSAGCGSTWKLNIIPLS